MQTLYIIISIVGTLVTTLTPSIIALIKAVKAKNSAQTVASTEQALNAVIAEVKKLIANYEVDLTPIDKLLKANNCGTAGSMKKRDVYTDLKVFCLENSIPWDDAKMNEIIEREIEFSNTVNAKK